MKTHTIKTPTAELLIVELPRKSDVEIFPSSIEIYNQFTGQEENIKGSYTLLGKTDEIMEEDARDLVELPIDKWGDDKFRFLDYRHDGHYDLFTAKESLLSLLESEIYWENPLANEIHAPDIEEWHEAERKTFDKSRTLIFKKN